MMNTTTAISVANDAVVRRLYARGIWVLHSPGHFGGSKTGRADMCLLRDQHGHPFVPAASIAGAARSYLARYSLPWLKYQDGLTHELPALKRLFGGADKNDTMSALIVDDAACDKTATTIRDSVRIDHKTGSAAAQAKFDVEIIECGTGFELNLQCIVRHGDLHDNVCMLEKWFLALLHGFQTGDIHLGARTRRGYGRGKVEAWDIRDLQMKEPADVMAWLQDTVWSRPASALMPCPLPADQRRYVHMQVDFALCTSLLIRSPSAGPQDPDVVHLQSGQQPVVPGTSMGGAFRHRATLIATVIGWSKDAVNEMFGPVHKQQTPAAHQEGLWASRVSIEEQTVSHVEPKRQHRVAIDRFTGGSLPGALFNEEPIFPQQPAPHLRLRLTLEEPNDAEIGLLLLTLRDFWYGHAALGGETGNGRGTLQGVKAELQLKRDVSTEAEIWQFAHEHNSMHLVQGDASMLKDCIDQAQCPEHCPTGSRRPPVAHARNSDAQHRT